MNELPGDGEGKGQEGKENINRISLLIQTFNELAGNEENFDEIINDRDKFCEFFENIRNIIENFKKIPEFKGKRYIDLLDNKFKEVAAKYYNVLEDAINLEFEQEISEDYRNINRTKQIAKYIYEKGEIKKDIKELIELTNANIRVFETLYHKQEQKKELIPKLKEKGLKALFNKFINTIIGKKKRLDEKKEDFHKQEDDSDKQAFRSSLKKVMKKYWEIEPSQKDLNKREELDKWEKRLEEYIRKIDEGEFCIEDMPEFIRDYSGVSLENRICSENYYFLQPKLKKIRKIIAEYYECSEDELLLESYYEHKDNDEDIPYKVIFGDLVLLPKKNKIGSCLEIIIGDADFRYTAIESLENIRTIYGMGKFESSKIRSLGKLRVIGNGASFYNCKIEDANSLENIYGEVDWGENKKLKKYLKNKHKKENNQEFFYEK